MIIRISQTSTPVLYSDRIELQCTAQWHPPHTKLKVLEYTEICGAIKTQTAKFGENAFAAVLYFFYFFKCLGCLVESTYGVCGAIRRDSRPIHPFHFIGPFAPPTAVFHSRTRTLLRVLRLRSSSTDKNGRTTPWGSSFVRSFVRSDRIKRAADGDPIFNVQRSTYAY